MLRSGLLRLHADVSGDQALDLPVARTEVRRKQHKIAASTRLKSNDRQRKRKQPPQQGVVRLRMGIAILERDHQSWLCCGPGI